MIDPPRETHLAIIRKQFPGISLADMTLDAGGEHYVYIANEATVFRFPQVPRVISLVREQALDWLAATNAIPFALPASVIEHDDEFDIWFERARYLPGVPFTPDVAATFSRGERLVIARQMGAFLSTLHALPLGPARELGMDEMDPTDFWDYMENNPSAYPWVRRTLWPVLPPAERAWIAQLFERFIAQARQTPPPLVIRHSAGDFKAFEYYGPEFVDEVYAHYQGAVDPGFERRRLFYTGHDVVFRLVRSYQLGDPAQIGQHHAELSAYIVGHPVR